MRRFFWSLVALPALFGCAAEPLPETASPGASVPPEVMVAHDCLDRTHALLDQLDRKSLGLMMRVHIWQGIKDRYDMCMAPPAPEPALIPSAGISS